MAATFSSVNHSPYCNGCSFFLINGRCPSCHKFPQVVTGSRAVISNEDFAEMKSSRLLRRLQQNTEEYYRLLAELKKIGADTPPRENRGLLTKRILEKAERRFPSRPTRHSRRVQKR